MLSDEAVLSLLWTAVFVVVTGFLVLRAILPPAVALGAMLAKVGLAAAFALYGDASQWTLLDDVFYYVQGRDLLSRGGDPFTFFVQGDGVLRLIGMSQGLHILYGWYNFLAQWLVGPYYFAPVLGNVLLTAVAARALHALVLDAGAPREEAWWTTLIFLVHWDVLAWSSFINVKDNLVLALTILLLLGYGRLARGVTYGRVAAVVVLSGLFIFLRFYVPVLALGCFLLTSAASRHALARNRLKVLAAGIALAAALYLAVGPALFALAISRLDLSPGNAVVGGVRILLTPQPWSIEPNYEYLLLPSVLHLVFLLPALAGVAGLWRRLPGARLAIAFYLTIVLVFALFLKQQGPRHRYQVVFVLVWGLVHLAREVGPAVSVWLRGATLGSVAATNRVS